MSDSMELILTDAASGMSAQGIRMNTIASNLANAGNVGGSDKGTYHAKYPIFSEITQPIAGLAPSDQPIGGVRVTDIKQSSKPLEKKLDPGNPNADENGYIYMTNVNPIDEMTNMIAASKDYEANIEIMNTTKSLLIQSLGVLNTK